MKSITSICISYRRYVLASTAGIILAVMTATWWLPETESEEVSEVVEPARAVYLSTSTVPVVVSGVVESANHTTVYAETAGVITSLPAREGAVVVAGTLLGVQSTPVADAQVYLAQTQAGLAALQQQEQVISKMGAADVASARAYSAEEIAMLRAASNDSRVAEATASLQTTVEQGVLAATQAIDFVHTHRSMFSADGLKLYDQVVAGLYGRMPDYFRSGVVRSTAQNDLAGLLSSMASETNSADVVYAATLLEAELQALTTLYGTGEEDVFDRQTYVDDATKATYLSLRGAVLSTQQALVGSRATYAQVADGVFEDVVGQGLSVTVSARDAAVAAATAELAPQIAAQAAVVSNAATHVAAATAALGRIQAPFSGTVAKVLVQVGEYVQPGTPLLTLVGAGAREVKVSVPATLLPQVTVGQSFISQSGVVLGQVDRFSPVAEGGSGQVVITLTAAAPSAVGTSVTGTLALTGAVEQYTVPRAYVHFDTSGPFVLYKDNTKSPVTIVYDAGTALVISPAIAQDIPLVPATSISL